MQTGDDREKRGERGAETVQTQERRQERERGTGGQLGRKVEREDRLWTELHRRLRKMQEKRGEVIETRNG